MTNSSLPQLTLPPRPLASIILAAGRGTRMKSDLPKVLHPIGSRPMIEHVLATATQVGAARVVVITPPEAPRLIDAVKPMPCLPQPEAKGTGDAVRAAQPALQDFKGEILILFGDTPLITETAISTLRQAAQQNQAAVTVAAFTPEDPKAYGRLILDTQGQLTKIVESTEASEHEKAQNLCNGGIMLFESEKLWPLLSELTNTNSKAEYYLTDCIALARQKGWNTAYALLPPDDLTGINSRAELAAAEKIFQTRKRLAAMQNGATLLDPETVYFAADTQIGRDVIIGQHVVFGPNVSIADGVEIKPFCHIEGTSINQGAIIGPFARLRPGSIIGNNAHIGNFVEIKNAEIGEGAKANHLTYIGDAQIGARSNIGAGTITCNYDGFTKAKTIIGPECFVGSNSALIAPVTLGQGVMIGAGSVITQDVPDNALALTRSPQEVRQNWASLFRAKRTRKKN